MKIEKILPQEMNSSGAIFSDAGAEKLQEECDSIGKCEVGQVLLGV